MKFPDHVPFSVKGLLVQKLRFQANQAKGRRISVFMKMCLAQSVCLKVCVYVEQGHLVKNFYYVSMLNKDT